jgi:hypothetical protein
MSTAIQSASSTALAGLDQDTMLALVAGGDCSRLSPAQKTAYYTARCEAAGLDPRAAPFQFTNLNGKLVLYASKSATDQLSAKHGIVCSIISQETMEGIRVVTVRATAKDGRSQEDIGAVTIKGLAGDALCNALMKCVTKAKRRTTLSLCGLGMLDETELETIAHAEPAKPHTAHVRNLPPVPAPADAKVIEPTEETDTEPEEEQEWSEVAALKVRISACTTLAQLLVLGAELKKLPEDVREMLRQSYAAKQAALMESK